MLKLVYSNENPSLGHCCNNDTSFSGMLRRLYTEQLPCSMVGQTREKDFPEVFGGNGPRKNGDQSGTDSEESAPCSACFWELSFRP
jgi:hypothetical protein